MQAISNFHFTCNEFVESNESEGLSTDVVSGEYRCGITLVTLRDIFCEAIRKEQVFIAKVRSNNFDRWYEGFAACQWLRHSYHDPMSRAIPEFVRLYQSAASIEEADPRVSSGGVVFREVFTCKSHEELVDAHGMMMSYAPISEQVAYLDDCFTHFRDIDTAQRLFTSLLEREAVFVEGYQADDVSQREMLFRLIKLACDTNNRIDHLAVVRRFLPLLLKDAGAESVGWFVSLGNSLFRRVHNDRCDKEGGLEALGVYSKALSYNPDNQEALFGSAVILAQGLGGVQSEVHQAIQYLEHAVELGHMPSLRYLCYIFCRYFGDGHEQALRRLRVVLSSDPCEATALSIAINLCRYGCVEPPKRKHHRMELDRDMAFHFIREALAVNPVDEVALWNLIQISVAGELDAHLRTALTYMLRAYKELPEDIELLKAIASIYKRGIEGEEVGFEQNYLKAIEYAERILELNPEDRDAYLLLALIYAEGGHGVEEDPEKSIEYLDAILRLDPLDFGVLYFFVRLCRDKGERCDRYLVKAVQYLRTAAIDSRSPANLLLAEIYLYGGNGVERNVDEAMRYLRNAALYGSHMRVVLQKLRSFYSSAIIGEEGSISEYYKVAASLIMRRTARIIQTTVGAVFHWLYFPSNYDEPEAAQLEEEEPNDGH